MDRGLSAGLQYSWMKSMFGSQGLGPSPCERHNGRSLCWSHGKAIDDVVALDRCLRRMFLFVNDAWTDQCLEKLCFDLEKHVQ